MAWPYRSSSPGQTTTATSSIPAWSACSTSMHMTDFSTPFQSTTVCSGSDLWLRPAAVIRAFRTFTTATSLCDLPRDNEGDAEEEARQFGHGDYGHRRRGMGHGRRRMGVRLGTAGRSRVH